jgi:translocation protein SEC63
MLSRAPELIEGMIEISYQRKWLETTFSAIKFSQCIIQGLWYTSHPLLQIPHITENEVKLILKSLSDSNRCMQEFLRTPDSDKKGLSHLSQEQQQDIFRVCKIIPSLKIETKLFVEEDEPDLDRGAQAEEVNGQNENDTRGDQIFEQDLVTLRVTLTKENITDGCESAPVHAPYFPKTVKEAWWVILTDKGTAVRKPNTEAGIHAVEKVTESSKKIVQELRFMAPAHAGTYEMDLHIFSDCYLGLDETISIRFEVHPASELPEYVAHPEDLELDNEPTLFEQVMAANVDDSSDDEDENPKKKSSSGDQGDEDDD